MVAKSYLRFRDGADSGVLAGQHFNNFALFRAPEPPAAVQSAPAFRPRWQRGPIAAAAVAKAEAEATVIAAVPALENVALWCTRTGDLLARLCPHELKLGATADVTAVAAEVDPHAPSTVVLAAGYASGHLSLWRGSYSTTATGTGAVRQVASGSGQQLTWTCLFYGLSHRPDTAVLHVSLDLASGRCFTSGQDTDVTVWDLAVHAPLYRLRGHRGAVVGACALPGYNGQLLVSGAADGLVKLWDLSVQQCVQTIIGSDTQVNAVAVSPDGTRVFVGIRDEKLRVFRVVPTSAVSSADAAMTASSSTAPAVHVVGPATLEAHGTLQRSSNKAPTSIVFSADGTVMLVVAAKGMDAFRVLSADDVARRVQRKLRRRREAEKKKAKAALGGDDAPPGTVDVHRAKRDQARAARVADAEAEGSDDESADEAQPRAAGATAAEEFAPIRGFNFGGKVRAVRVLRATRTDGEVTEVQFVMASASNSVEVLSSARAESDAANGAAAPFGDLQHVRSIGGQAAHAGEVKTVVFGPGETVLVTTSADTVKAWGVSHYTSRRDAEAGGMADDEDDDWFYVDPNADDVGARQRKRLACLCTFDMAALTVVDEMRARLPVGDLHAVRAVVLPGDDLVVVGTMEGHLLLLSIAAQGVVACVPAHTAAITDVVLGADGGASLLTSGKDRRVVRWTLRLQDPRDANSATLDLEDEMELTDTPLALGVTAGAAGAMLGPQITHSNQNASSAAAAKALVAVALQDFTVRLFYSDTFKPFLTLYGHKLPVTAIAFSRDGNLCATVGMDKSLRFWGTDFGDCHRAIHAHDNYIHGVRFLGPSHHVVTVALDGAVKFWDGDTWTLIQVLRSNQNGLLAVGASRDGTCVATAGVDRCVRLVRRTEEMLFPQEEQERMAREAQDEAAAKKAAMQRLDDAEVGDVAVAAQKTVATAEAAEMLMSALDDVSVEIQRREAIAAGTVDAASTAASLNIGRTDPYVYFWNAVERVKPSELRHTLSALTHTHMHSFLRFLLGAARGGAIRDYELAARALTALVKPAPGSNTAPPLLFANAAEAEELLGQLGKAISWGLRRDCDRMGFGVAGVTYMMQRLEAEKRMRFHDRTKVQGAMRKVSSVKIKIAKE